MGGGEFCKVDLRHVKKESLDIVDYDLWKDEKCMIVPKNRELFFLSEVHRYYLGEEGQ